MTCGTFGLVSWSCSLPPGASNEGGVMRSVATERKLKSSGAVGARIEESGS